MEENRNCDQSSPTLHLDADQYTYVFVCKVFLSIIFLSGIFLGKILFGKIFLRKAIVTKAVLDFILLTTDQYVLLAPHSWLILHHN